MAGFEWNPDAKQEYVSSFGNTTLSETGTHFAKKCETDFTMNAPGCALTLEVTDGTDILWPQLEDGDADKKLNMVFENGDFNIQSNGDIYIGLSTKKHQDEENSSIFLDASAGYIKIRSPDGSIFLGGKKKSCLQARENGDLLFEAEQISFPSGNIRCEGEGSMTLSAVRITLDGSGKDTGNEPPRFDLITDKHDNHYRPRIEFWHPTDLRKNPWAFSKDNNHHGVFNFDTNGNNENKKGIFIFNGQTEESLSALMEGGYLAINNTPVIGKDAASKVFNFNQDGNSGRYLVSLK